MGSVRVEDAGVTGGESISLNKLRDALISQEYEIEQQLVDKFGLVLNENVRLANRDDEQIKTEGLKD